VTVCVCCNATALKRKTVRPGDESIAGTNTREKFPKRDLNGSVGGLTTVFVRTRPKRFRDTIAYSSIIIVHVGRFIDKCYSFVIISRRYLRAYKYVASVRRKRLFS